VSCIEGCLRIAKILATGSVLILGYSAYGQMPVAFSRYNDNFPALAADSTHRFTLLPQLKMIPLFFNSASFISIGGEVKEQLFKVNHERWDADAKGVYAPGSDGAFLLQRIMVHTNLVVSPYLRFFGELKSGLESGRSTGPRPYIDEDRLDVNQVFIDVDLFPGHQTDLLVRAGRQELAYGASRLISENEGPNVRLAFQGYRAVIKTKWLAADGFYSRPVDNLPGIFDDKTSDKNKLYGIYLTIPLAAATENLLDVYLIGNINDKAVYLKETSAENRRSWGIRIYRKQIVAVTYDLETIYQEGKFGNSRIRAYGIVARLNYNFSVGRLLKTISLVGQVASGDRGKAGELNTFNPLYTRVYYGIGAPYWPSNIKQITPSADFRLGKQVVLTADVHFLWRDNINDGLYFVNAVRSATSVASGLPSRHSFIGAQQDIDVVWSLKPYWYLEGLLTYLPETAYIKDSGHGSNIVFLGLQTKFSF
jgi:hypothetical protein